jgi:uncharacterized protein affecting Mg2+/Co2+ transport
LRLELGPKGRAKRLLQGHPPAGYGLLPQCWAQGQRMPREQRNRTKTPDGELAAAPRDPTAENVEAHYRPDLSDPADAKNPFWTWGYKNIITNNLSVAITVLERHWKIKPRGRYKVQETSGFGIVGAQRKIEPGESYPYCSGVPLPTPEGGTMEGFYVVRIEDKTRRKIRVPVERFLLKKGTAKDVERTKPERSDSAELDRQLERYVADCARNGEGQLDTRKLPASAQWAFQRLCLGNPDFNSRKEGKLKTLDVRDAMKVVSIDVKSTIEYSDIFLFGENLSDLRIKLLYIAKKDEGLVQDPKKELIKRIKGRPDLAVACLKFLDKEITRPEYAKLSAELTESRIEKVREQQRGRQARRRQRQRAAAAQAG